VVCDWSTNIACSHVPHSVLWPRSSSLHGHSRPEVLPVTSVLSRSLREAPTYFRQCSHVPHSVLWPRASRNSSSTKDQRNFQTHHTGGNRYVTASDICRPITNHRPPASKSSQRHGGLTTHLACKSELFINQRSTKLPDPSHWRK
jgi:hypothetical protein